jgi:hypothetical protein
MPSVKPSAWESNMKRVTLTCLSICLAMSMPVAAQTTDPNPAENNPDKFSWELFVQVTRPANVPGRTDVVFETWASRQDTFTANPLFPGDTSPPSCSSQPVVGAAAPAAPAAPAASAAPAAVAAASPKVLQMPALEEFGPRVPGLQPHVVAGGEEVRRNRATFDFIYCNKLYNRAGLRAAFAAGVPISFPIESIEVKADWRPIAGLDTSQYYVNTASDNQRYALVAMHIISKQVPNWTWATFEHKNNAGRCDFMGCRDRFGATVQNQGPQTTTNGQYPACEKTPALKKMFADANISAQWENYCLKGSQLDFITPTGLPTVLGNSVIENGFARTSSCMTCHARASVASNGSLGQGAGFLPTGQSPNGAPDPNWFYDNLGQPNQTVKTFPTDFVFSIPLRAIP